MSDLSPREIYRRITANIEKVMRGQSAAVRKLLAGFASGGHVLLEDYPGTGKTTLAKTLALSLDAEFKRIQFTPDLLPSDILGVSIFDQKEQMFRLHKGDQSSPTSCSPMRSIGPHLERNRPCWRPWQRGR